MYIRSIDGKLTANPTQLPLARIGRVSEGGNTRSRAYQFPRRPPYGVVIFFEFGTNRGAGTVPFAEIAVVGGEDGVT